MTTLTEALHAELSSGPVNQVEVAGERITAAPRDELGGAQDLAANLASRHEEGGNTHWTAAGTWSFDVKSVMLHVFGVAGQRVAVHRPAFPVHMIVHSDDTAEQGMECPESRHRVGTRRSA